MLIPKLKEQHFMYFNYRPAYKVRRQVIFSACLSVQTRGEGLPHLHPIIFPLVPCPFWGTHLHPIILPLVICPFWRDTPVTGPRRSEYLSPRWGRYPSPRQGRFPHSGQDGVPAQPGLGYPFPRDRLRLDRLCRGRYASFGFPQEDSCSFM